MLNDIIIPVMEIIGTIAFSVSGALIAISCSLDIFGVITVACLTATGGGIIRDVLINQSSPLIFQNPKIALLSLITALTVFTAAYANSQKFYILREKIEYANNFFDALGLAAFSVTGIETACTAGYSGNAFFVITMGVITGVGGGLLRDILVNETPYILKKHIYALVSIGGSLFYYIIRTYTSLRTPGTIIIMTAMVLSRLLAAKFRWKLPKIDVSDK